MIYVPDSGGRGINERASLLASGAVITGDAVMVEFYGCVFPTMRMSSVLD